MPGEKITCKGCDKKFQLLLSHLERTKSCQDSYDMSSMRKEAEILTKERKAQRSRERYQIDPDEAAKKRDASQKYYKQHTPEKRAAAKEYYKQHTPEKKATMAQYYERHKEKINSAKREQYQSDPEKKLDKSEYYYETPSHHVLQQCLECDKGFFTRGEMKRHIDHAHSEENFATCQICDKQFRYKQNIERHMKEVHSGERHKCEKCPATFSRGTDLQEHIKQDWHYLSYNCRQCSKTIVFKSLKGLIQHTIVKQSEGEQIGADGTKWKIYKSGILVTCKSKVESTQLKDGEHVLCMERKEKAKAAKERFMKKEEIINEGLQSAAGNLGAPKVKLVIEKDEHEKNDQKDRCYWCKEKVPFFEKHCSIRFHDGWKLLRDDNE